MKSSPFPASRRSPRPPLSASFAVLTPALIKGSDHIRIILAASTGDDVVHKKILEFIRAHAK